MRTEEHPQDFQKVKNKFKHKILRIKIADFSTAMLETKRKGSSASKVLRGYFQTRTSYPSKLLSNCEGRIKIFADMQVSKIYILYIFYQEADEVFTLSKEGSKPRKKRICNTHNLRSLLNITPLSPSSLIDCIVFSFLVYVL